MHSGILAAIAMVFARYVGYFIPLSALSLKVVAASGVTALSALNYRGVREGSRAQMVLTSIKVAAVLAIVAMAFIAGSRAGTPGAAAAAAPIGASNFLLAVGAGLFAFGGWHMVTYASDETIAPERTIPRALVIGVLLVTVCYISLNAAYLHVLPLDAVIRSRGVAADAAEAVMGSGGKTLAATVVVISTLGALNGIVLAGPRVYYAMAQDGLLFRWAGGVHERFRTPHRAIAIQGAWTVVLVLTGTYETLFSRVIYTEWIFFGFMALALLQLRRRATYAPLFKVPGHPVTPLLFALAAFAVAANQIASSPVDSLVGIALVLSGVPVYWLTMRRVRSA